MCHSDKHLEGCKQIASEDTTPDTERLLKKKQCQILHNNLLH
jgi:hypothetical protein